MNKIKCIYKNITNSDLTTLATLFLAPAKPGYEVSIANRKTHISRRWLNQKESNFTPRTFKSEYKDYAFYKEIRIENRPLFKDAYEFLELPIEEFCKRVYKYVSYKNSLYIDNENFTYNYLYLFKDNYVANKGKEKRNAIQEYQISYGKKLSTNSIEITVTPSDGNTDEKYSGIAKYKDSKLILQFENEWNYVTVISSLEFMNHKTSYLIGILSGFSEFNKKIPGAKKVILTRIKALDINRQYLTLNETEILYAEENSYKFTLSSYDYLKNHFQKYATKVDSIDKLFDNLTKNGYYTDIYYQLAFREIHSLNMLFKKVQNGLSYYIKHRYNILKTLFKTYIYEPYKYLYMVTPIYSNHFVFDYFSPEVDEIFKALQALKQKEVEIEIIFVINNCKSGITPVFQENLKILSKLARIHFVQKEKIVGEFESIDFFFTENDNLESEYIIYKPLHFFYHIFTLSKEIHLVQQFKTFYKQIRFYSKPYKSPFKFDNYCSFFHNSIEELLGEWYLYLYGSQQLWELKVIIYSNNYVEFYYKDKLSYRGELTNKKYQSIILAEDINSKMITTYIFDNNMQELNHAFLVKAISKQYKSDSDMFTIGICSKEPIELQDIEYILGERKEQTVFIDDLIKARLSDYIFEKFEKN